MSEQYKEELRNRYFDGQIALREKHFSLDQLRAMLDFYSSDMGKSILESQNKMIDDTGFKLVSSSDKNVS